MQLIENSFDYVDERFYNKKVLGSEISWKSFCTIINKVILEKNNFSMSSEDKRLGVYFVNSDELGDNKKFSQKVIKYLWDDAFKFDRDKIFNKNYDSLEYIIKEINKEDSDKLSIFSESLQNKLINKKETKVEDSESFSEKEESKVENQIEQAEYDDTE